MAVNDDLTPRGGAAGSTVRGGAPCARKKSNPQSYYGEWCAAGLGQLVIAAPPKVSWRCKDGKPVADSTWLPPVHGSQDKGAESADPVDSIAVIEVSVSFELVPSSTITAKNTSAAVSELEIPRPAECVQHSHPQLRPQLERQPQLQHHHVEEYQPRKRKPKQKGKSAGKKFLCIPVQMVYTIFSCGTLRVRTKLSIPKVCKAAPTFHTPDEGRTGSCKPVGITSLPRVGLSFCLPEDLSSVRWFGRGPHECYPVSAAFLYASPPPHSLMFT